MWVAVNRSHQDKVPLDKVILGKNQFSSMTILGDPCTVRWPQSPCDSFLGAIGMANAILSGTDTSDPTHGAYYYANLANTTSQWFKDNVETKTPLVKIGNHTFFPR